jgi:tyrosine-specific transport protein
VVFKAAIEKGIGIWRILSACLLVAGTCIGGGMLALPVATATAGFFPSALMMVVSWAFMTGTALLLLEVNLWMQPGAHAMSMAGRFLGRWGKGISCLLFLFMSYFSLVAYLAGSGTLISQLGGPALGTWVGTLGIALLLGWVIRLGHSKVGRVNSLLVVGMGLAYLLLVGGGVGSIESLLLTRQSWGVATWGLPLMLTMFSFQTIVPSLTPILQRHPGALRLAIIGGTTLALLIYLLWQGVILGTVPLEGSNSLTTALLAGQPATTALGHHVGFAWIAGAGHLFALFALTTSFLGIGLSLYDFLADGLKWQGRRPWSLASLVVFPSLAAALISPKLFYWALDATGGFGDTILNGLIPIFMVWVGRYRQRLPGSHQLPGGRITLLALMGWALLVLVIEVAHHF